MPTRPRKPGGRPAVTAFGRYLLQHGRTSEWLAQATGYSEPTVRSWRSGTYTPSRGALALIAQALEIGDTKTATGPQRVLRMIKTPIASTPTDGEPNG